MIRIVDGPVGAPDRCEELPPGEIGELIVSGPVVTREYVTRTEANALGKILDGAVVWHRMGDAGYLDSRQRFWFCGRVAHRVLTAAGPMYPVRCEAIFNQHEDVFRSALVGVGPPGRQRPVMILEPKPGRMPVGRRAREAWLAEIRRLGSENPLTAPIDNFLLHPAFPVDIRHNVKIFREKLAVWAAKRLRRGGVAKGASPKVATASVARPGALRYDWASLDTMPPSLRKPVEPACRREDTDHWRRGLPRSLSG